MTRQQHGGMLPAWPVFSEPWNGQDTGFIKIIRDRERAATWLELRWLPPLFPAGHILTRQSLWIKLAPGEEATACLHVLVPGLHSLSQTELTGDGTVSVPLIYPLA